MINCKFLLYSRVTYIGVYSFTFFSGLSQGSECHSLCGTAGASFMHSAYNSVHVTSPRLPVLLSILNNHSLFCESVSVSRVCSFVSFWGLFFSFFGCATQHAGPCLSGQGWCPYPLRWKHRPLTTGLHRGGPFVDIFFPFIDFLRMAILTGVTWPW